MSGIDWQTIGQTEFDRIVDTLLAHEYGPRGHTVDGRGGDAGIDYTVDDNAIIFQYKYFSNGISASRSRRGQIQKSFTTALQHSPKEWILVVPCNLTLTERTWLLGLGSGTGVQIGLRDRVWLDKQLTLHIDVANYYRFYSDDEYLMSKAALFKENPIVSTPKDVTDRVRQLTQSVADSDPNWAVDIHTRGDDVIQVLRPKHSEAATLAPINVTFNLQASASSEEPEQLRQARAFGVSKPIYISGDMVKDFKITGPKLAAYEGPVAEIGLVPECHDTWIDTDLILEDGDGGTLGGQVQ